MKITDLSARNVSSKHPQKKTHRQKRKSLIPANHVELERLTLVGLLYWRHCNPHDPFSDVPYSQPEISQILSWDQSRVSRRMAMIFPGGMKKYYQSFADNPAHGYLVAGSENGSGYEGIQNAEYSIDDADQELMDLILVEIHRQRTTLHGIEHQSMRHLAA